MACKDEKLSFEANAEQKICTFYAKKIGFGRKT